MLPVLPRELPVAPIEAPTLALDERPTLPETFAALLRFRSRVMLASLLLRAIPAALWLDALLATERPRCPFEREALRSPDAVVAFEPVTSRLRPREPVAVTPALVLLEAEPGWAHWLGAVREFLGTPPAAVDAFPTLSARQREVLDELARGRDNAQIAARLGLSEKTVRNQVSAIFDKLGAETRAQAIVQAREAGFGRA